MTEVEYWFKTRMYTMGILALVIAFIQVSNSRHDGKLNILLWDF